MTSLCNDWEFTEEWSDSFLNNEGEYPKIRIPHTVREVPQHYAKPEDYEMLCGYRKVLDIPEDCSGKRIFLQFDGAAHVATLYVNGKELCTHNCGYTAFRAEITDAVRYGRDNVICLKLDTSEKNNIPPFGNVIDYLCYGGIYREVWLDVRSREYISDIYITSPDLETAHIEVTASGGDSTRITILDGEIPVAEGTGFSADIKIPSANAWSPDSPALYICRVELLSGGEVTDIQTISFGIRTIECRADGFYLNGTRTFMRGLNRHQCYPYIGYAAPESLQRNDARILKHELQCNAVRTSHYPQSQYFIDECDRIGLLVFTEIPGWQHIGDEKWQKQAIENTKEMVLQYRNHPSIVLWGVRINESQDSDEFYRQTNAAARAFDHSRPTTGVRYIENSSLLEDVYSYNDFSHNGKTAGVKPKKQVMKDMTKGLIISEHNGHMFPTKSFDNWSRRLEQTIRHARVLNDAMADGEHLGCFGWCMFDYPTHRDFGSGDRVCYHGVMDAFRNPKLAAALYASQGDENPVLEIGSPMDIGDYPAGVIGDIWAFTNADEIELYKNEQYVGAFTSKQWSGLPHGPVLIDDLIGCLLETVEHYPKKKAENLKKSLNAIRNYGIESLPLKEKLRIAHGMLKYHMSYAQCYDLYGKYVANWGSEATIWKFAAKQNGETVAEAIRCPGTNLHFEVKISSDILTENQSYDMAAVRVRILDDNNNTASYCQIPVNFSIYGPAELAGPSTAAAEGGMTGTYIRSIGKTGMAFLKISAEGITTVEKTIKIKI